MFKKEDSSKNGMCAGLMFFDSSPEIAIKIKDAGLHIILVIAFKADQDDKHTFTLIFFLL